MALLKIPTRSDLPNYRYRIDLEEQVYELEFRYNGRMNRWLMDVRNELGENLRAGVLLLTEVNMFPYLKSSTLPPGIFLVVHETLQNINPGRDELGDTIDLFYNEAN